MADTYIEYDYLPKKKQRRFALKKHRRWPYVLLGALIGFLVMPVVIAATIFVFVNRPLGKTVTTIDNMSDSGLYQTLFGYGPENPGILDVRYSNMKLTDAIGEISAIAGKGSQLTFADLATISPKIEKTVDDLVASAKDKSIILEKEALMTTPLNQFSGLLMDEVKELSLGELLLSVSPEIFDDPSSGAILKNLFFGREGINYVEYEEDGILKVEMLPLTYTYDNTLNQFVCIDGTVYTQNGDVWTAENENYISGESETFALYSPDGELIHQLQSGVLRTLNSFTAVTMQDGIMQPIKQSALLLGSFMDGGDPLEMIGKLELGILLGVHLEENATSEDNKMLTALAYGTYGVDYTFENGKVVPLGDSSFTTLNSLMTSPEEVLNDVQLGTLLGITTRTDAEAEGNAMLVALAYGAYNVDFVYDANGVIIQKDGGREFTTLGSLLEQPDAMLEGIQLGSLLGITTREDVENSDALLVALAYGTYGTDFDYDVDGNVVPVNGATFTTLATLLNSGNIESIFADIPLSSLFSVDVFDPNEDPLTVSLIYGTKGKHYEILYNNGTPYIEWLPNEETSDPNDVYGERTFGTLRDGDLTGIVNDLRVGDVFQVTATSPKLLASIQNWTIADLGKQEKINSLKLKDVIDLGTTGVLADMGEWSIGEISEEKIKSIKLSSLLDASSGGLIGALANGTDDAGNPWTIGDLNETNIKKLKIGDVLFIDDTAHPLFIYMKNNGTTLGDINKSFINDITLENALGLDDSVTDPILLQIKDLSLLELQDATLLKNKIGNLYLYQVIEIPDDASGILKKMSSWKINEINQDKINGLHLFEIMEISDDDFYLKHVKNSTLVTLADDINNITIVDMFGLNAGSITGTWKYLLKYNPDTPDTNPSDDPKPEDYKISDMNAMIENMHNNIEQATLQDLHDDNMMPHLGNDMLQTALIYQIKKGGVVLADFSANIKDILGDDYEIKDVNGDGKLDDKTIGSLNVLEVAQYLTYLLDAIGSL
ncbi:MAG: hypothetical protein E7352_03185 [Clostridiales bacterium]|nr:hypothetical protein [Clostridiales bacterium]